jgi:sucrose-6-phosphate hydrolase SacC (GH32 family)
MQNLNPGALNGGSGVQYFVGNFDGEKFTNDNPPDQIMWFDHGTDNYAGVTWSGLPGNRNIVIGWMSNWVDYAQTVPTVDWRSATTIPRDIKLVKTESGYRLTQLPVKEFKSIVDYLSNLIRNESILTDSIILHNEKLQHCLNVTFNLSATSPTEVGFTLSNALNEQVVIGFDLKKNQCYVDRTKSGKHEFSTLFSAIHHANYVFGKQITVKALIDVASIELFVEQLMNTVFIGLINLATDVFPHPDLPQKRSESPPFWLTILFSLFLRSVGNKTSSIDVGRYFNPQSF